MPVAEPMLHPDGQLPWFALFVRTRHEKGVASALGQKGYRTFLPVYSVVHRWSDRLKFLDLPLFPGYLFCRFDPKDQLPILVTSGVWRIVGVGRTPCPVAPAELDAIRSILQSGLAAARCPYVQEGDRVCIDGGPLHGIVGIVIKRKNMYRLIVSVSLIERSVAVEVDQGWLRPLGVAA